MAANERLALCIARPLCATSGCFERDFHPALTRFARRCDANSQVTRRGSSLARALRLKTPLALCPHRQGTNRPTQEGSLAMHKAQPRCTNMDHSLKDGRTPKHVPNLM